jgi:excinuclease ABC subunit C
MATNASCVVFAMRPDQAEYRRYNIDGVERGDDYGALSSVAAPLTPLKAEESALPELLLIEWRQGQLEQAINVLAELELELPAFAAVAKGADRRAAGAHFLRAMGRLYTASDSKHCT